MYSRLRLLIAFVACFLPSAFACEGECIVQITEAFLGNYSVPIHVVFGQLAEQISEQLLPPERRPSNSLTLLQPILAAYEKVSYGSLETAIFPSYFHGKCQRFSKDGQDPSGCPNPDCPVVCGTPGSLVHFYSTLRYIAFNNTKVNLERLTTPGNPAYNQVDALVKKAQVTGPSKRDSRVATRGMGVVIDSSREYYGRSHPRQLGSIRTKRIEFDLQARSPTLASILSQFDNMFDEACGGNARDSEGALPRCSWEKEMKEFILTFP